VLDKVRKLLALAKRWLSEDSGYPVPLVDTILRLCCNLGAIAIEPKGVRPLDPWLVCRWVQADRDAKAWGQS
jgi:hypothetical protein